MRFLWLHGAGELIDRMVYTTHFKMRITIGID